MPRCAAMLALQSLQSQRKCELCAVIHVKHRTHEIVPATQELKERDHCQRRTGEWHHDMPENFELRAAVNARGVKEVLGQAKEKLTEQEDEERSTEPRRHPERLKRAGPAQRA